MYVIRARNVNEALYQGLHHLASCGQRLKTRNGFAITSPYPVTTIYENSTERVLFYPERDANPFFHFFEALWLIQGRNDVDFLTRFVKRMADYSDDGITLHGAYGYRWRRHFRFDQIESIISLLKDNPDSRRAVLTMWDPDADLYTTESRKDIPCNTQIYFRVRLGRADEPNRLDMTVTCRSNDIIWGAYGANAVHFSFLQEYIADHLGLLPGRYYQVSNDYHAYEDVFYKTYRGDLRVSPAGPIEDAYKLGEVHPHPLSSKDWKDDLNRLFSGSNNFESFFFKLVVDPLWTSHHYYKEGNIEYAISAARECAATDWRRAAIEWLERRKK